MSQTSTQSIEANGGTAEAPVAPVPAASSSNTAVPSSTAPTSTAEPTNATFPSKYAKKKLVKKQQSHIKLKRTIWLVGHLATIVFGLISIVFQVLWLPNKYYINSISYRLSLLGAMTALGATLSHRVGIRELPPISSLLAHQNVQYLILAIIWCFTFKSILKLLPYVLISVLQIASHHNISIVMKEQDFFASFIAYDELVLAVYLLLRTIFFRNTSGYQLAVFIVFYWLRILFNKETGNLFRAIVERLDGKVTTSVKNKKVLKAWNKTKGYLELKGHEVSH